MTYTELINQTFHTVSCYSCGVPFGITADIYRRVVTDAVGSIYCPACGKTSMWRESDDQKKIKALEAKLKWEMENTERARAMRDEAQKSVINLKGQVTKAKRRAAHGVCPCCKRTFKQLSEHMKMQHPDFVEENK